MSYEITRDDWSKCEICQKSLGDIKKEAGGGKVYFSHAFRDHLKNDHSLSLDEYFLDVLKIPREECPCGLCKKPLKLTISGAHIRYKKLACGRTPGTLEWSKRAKTERLGENNPMYKKPAWNKGLTADTSDIMKKIGEDRLGMKFSDETKSKQSESAKKRLVHGHTGMPHSEKTKQRLRETTLASIKRGVFKQTKSKPHIRMAEILDSIGVKYEEEKRVSFFSFDFYLIDLDTYLEVDGDYFHSNPKIYPNGPKTKTQKVNAVNDYKKNAIMTGERFIRLWECDILNRSEEIGCKLKEYSQSLLWEPLDQ